MTADLVLGFVFGSVVGFIVGVVLFKRLDDFLMGRETPEARELARLQREDAKTARVQRDKRRLMEYKEMRSKLEDGGDRYA